MIWQKDLITGKKNMIWQKDLIRQKGHDLAKRPHQAKRPRSGKKTSSGKKTMIWQKDLIRQKYHDLANIQEHNQAQRFEIIFEVQFAYIEHQPRMGGGERK
jgi:hypothetical protein